MSGTAIHRNEEAAELSDLMGRYRLHELLGIGSFGRVFRATDLVSRRTVAVKEFDRALGRSNGFLRELGILFELKHQRIVKCENLFMQRGTKYLVYEFMDSGSLREFLRSPQYSVVTACRMIRQAALGVAHAHGSGIIHRDLKPENILIRSICGSLQAKVGDFGIAVLGSSIGPMKGLGSPAYMAPEQFYDRFTESVDVYALGVMLYEACCGHRPFTGPPSHIVRAQIHFAPEIPEWLPSGMSSLLVDCLAKRPEERPSSVKEVIDRIDESLAKEHDYFERELWPVRGSTSARLLAIPGAALIEENETLTRYDLRGRVVLTYPNVETVVTNEKHFLIKQGPRWTLVTPVGKTEISGIPAGAKVALSAEGSVAYVHDGGAVLLDNGIEETIRAAGSGVLDVCFVGSEQKPWLIMSGPEGCWVQAGDQAIRLPGPLIALCGHSEYEAMLARDGEREHVWLLVSQNGVRRFEQACDRFQCDGENFVGAREDGAVIYISATSNRIAETHLDDDLKALAVASGLTLWSNSSGDVHAIDWK